MTTLLYKGKQFHLFDGESVLEGLLRAGEDVAHSCRSGICKSCTMVCNAGAVSAEAQVGLREREIRSGLFLACKFKPTQDLEVRDCGDDDLIEAKIIEHDRLTDTVVRLRVWPKKRLSYAAGQYLAVRRDDGLTRTFSIASLPSERYLEFHVRRVPDGQMSPWLYDFARAGTQLQLKQAHGQCYYPEDELDAPMLLVGTGTGLGPLWGIVRAALAAGHRGPITLFHGGTEPASLYMKDELEALARQHPQLRVRRCVLNNDASVGGVEIGAVDELALDFVSTHEAAEAEWLAFLCGNPELVKRLRMRLFMAGLAARRIFADAFLRAKNGSGE